MKSLKSVKVNAVSDIPPSQLMLGMIATSIIGILLMGGLNNAGIVRWFAWISALLVLGVYGLFFCRDKRFQRTKVASYFYYRAFRGDTRIAKYACDVAHLKKHIPLEKVYDYGLIKFTYMRYGVLIKTKPSRGDEEDPDAHHKRVEALINTLHGKLSMKLITGTRIDPVRVLDQELLDAANEQGKTKEQRDHLYELFQENQDKKPYNEWTSYIYLGLGEHASETSARVLMDSNLPGIKTAMEHAEITHSVLLNELDVLVAYRELMVSRRLK